MFYIILYKWNFIETEEFSSGMFFNWELWSSFYDVYLLSENKSTEYLASTV